MKTLLPITLLIITIQTSFAEGIASRTIVTEKNAATLSYHQLTLTYSNPQDGRNCHVRLTVRPNGENLPLGCDVMLRDEAGKKTVFDIVPRVIQLRDSSYLEFSIAEDLVDRVVIEYDLPAENEESSHYFVIEGRKIKKIAKRTHDRLAEQDGAEQPATAPESVSYTHLTLPTKRIV